MQPFSEVVAGEAWRSEAEDWIALSLGRIGIEVTGEIEQPRIRPWSTQLVVPTDAGTVWFKANCPATAFEPRLHATLAGLEPEEVDAPLAIDAGRGWILTADRGTTLGESHEPTLQDWVALVTLAATVQRRLARHGADLVGAGLPDCSPQTVPTRYDEMAQRLARLPADHPSHLSGEAWQALWAARPRVVDAARALAEAPLPVSLQHGDLHPRNVFAVDGGMRVFDFGDAQWAHALEILAVPYGWITRVSELPWERVLDAYASVWSDVISRDGLERLMSHAMVTHAVNRSWTWWGATERATVEELAEWGDAPLYYLRLSLEPFPPES